MPSPLGASLNLLVSCLGGDLHIPDREPEAFEGWVHTRSHSLHGNSEICLKSAPRSLLSRAQLLHLLPRCNLIHLRRKVLLDLLQLGIALSYEGLSGMLLLLLQRQSLLHVVYHLLDGAILMTHTSAVTAAVMAQPWRSHRETRGNTHTLANNHFNDRTRRDARRTRSRTS